MRPTFVNIELNAPCNIHEARREYREQMGIIKNQIRKLSAQFKEEDEHQLNEVLNDKKFSDEQYLTETQPFNPQFENTKNQTTKKRGSEKYLTRAEFVDGQRQMIIDQMMNDR